MGYNDDPEGIRWGAYSLGFAEGYAEGLRDMEIAIGETDVNEQDISDRVAKKCGDPDHRITIER